uniref:EF-hand domain-containing protein n=1 Tax=Panagrolaimus sp. JU765 TaxID=591449 RepID=A0AC34RQP3_9BILA
MDINQQQFGPQPLPQNQFIPNGQFFPNQFQPNSFPNQQFPGPVQQPQFLPNQQNSPVFAPNVPIPTPSPVPSNQPGQPLPPASTSQRVPPSLQETPLVTTTPPAPPTPKIVPPPVDKNVDLDGDGALSLAEVQYAAFVHHGLSSSVVENMFNQVDKNKDGYLTSIEFNEIRSLVLAKAENAALRYLKNVDTNHNGLLSLPEAQAYILKEYGISNRDVERIWRLVVPNSNDEMDAVLFSKLRRRVRGMSIRLARQIMKNADQNEDGHIDLHEAQQIAFEQEGIGAADVVEMLASVDDNNDGELNAPEFADFERIVRARAVETSKKALKVVDTDGSGTLTMDEAKRIAFDHYGFDERTLEPFFAQADENEDGQLDAVEFAGFRSVIRSRAVKNAQVLLPEVDTDGDGFVSNLEAEEKARREDDMDPKETFNLFSVADQDKNNALDKVELADFVRLVRLSAIKYATDHLREFDSNRDKKVTLDELQTLIEEKYSLDPAITAEFFQKVDVDFSDDLNPGEVVDFRHEVRKFVAERDAREEIQAQHRREMTEIEARLKQEADDRLALIKAKEQESKAVTEQPAKETESVEEAEEEEEEEVTTTTAAPQLKKKKRVLKKHKDAVVTTTVEPTTEEQVTEEVTQPELENVSTGKNSTEKIVRDSTLEELEDADSKEATGTNKTSSEVVEEQTTENSVDLEKVETVSISAEPTTTTEEVTTAPEPTESTVSEDVTEANTDVTLKKRKKIKKLRVKTTPAVVEDVATEAPTTVEETTIESTTVEVTTEATTPSTTESTTTTEEAKVETPTTTHAATEPAAETTEAAEAVEYEEVEEDEPTTTTTTAKPKKRRLRKKPATTTTPSPEEYEEVEE